MNNNLHGRVRPPLKTERLEKPFPWSNPKNAYMWGFIHGIVIVTVIRNIPVIIVMIILFVNIVSNNADEAARIFGLFNISNVFDSFKNISGKIRTANTEVGTYFNIFSNHSGVSELVALYIALNRIVNVIIPEITIVAHIIIDSFLVFYPIIHR